MSRHTHENVVIRRGERTGLPVIVAVHSTVRGQAIGGCRVAAYPDWRDGLADALRLSAAMTAKSALAGLPHGGGKTVVALPEGLTLDDADRHELLLDVGDTIAGLDGTYATGPDVGTGPADMATIGLRTPYVFCRPDHSGDSSPHTALGVVAALEALCAHRFGEPDLGGRSFAILGLGRVGGHVARLLADAGATLVVSDVDPARHAGIGEFVTPRECLTAPVDVLVPAALGGVLTPATVAGLRCAAIAGPANNQLDAPATAGLLHDRAILWAPDIVVSAGGIVNAVSVELGGLTAAEATDRVRAIGSTLATLLRDAEAAGITPAEAARLRAEELVVPRRQ